MDLANEVEEDLEDQGGGDEVEVEEEGSLTGIVEMIEGK